MLKLLNSLMIWVIAINLFANTGSAADAPAGGEFDYFQLIDSAHPPTEGVWMSFARAQDFIYNSKLNARDSQIDVLSLKKQLELANAQIGDMQEQSRSRSFLESWGLPLGVASGLLLSVGIYFSVRK